MTTEAAAKRYLAEHMGVWGDRKFAVFNPHNKPVEDLPVIYGFNNGGSPEFWYGVLLAEDGAGLGSHLCSDEAYMYHDLGIVSGARPDRHETFREHYPDGYRMDFVPCDEVRGHKGLNEAFARNQARIRGETDE